MRFNEDNRIKKEIPFIHESTILFMDSSISPSGALIRDNLTDIQRRLRLNGYSLVYLPAIVDSITPSVLGYMFPGWHGSVSVDDMYNRIRIAAGLKDEAGFLYKKNGEYIFLPFSDNWFDLIPAHSEEKGPMFSLEASKKPEGPEEPEKQKAQTKLNIPRKKIEVNTDDLLFNEEVDTEDFEPKTTEIIRAWKSIERRFNITVEDLQEILGYRIKLSRLFISRAGKITLPDWDGCPEVKMDDLTKALYFLYLRHPEGIELKRVVDYSNELLGIYRSITGRDDPEAIRKTIEDFVEPYSNARNVSVSRIKTAFKNIVGDRIAKSYYIDGYYAGPRKVSLDRDLVIWKH